MTSVVLLEPDGGPAWFPFADCRPVCELRAGVWLIRERWEAVAQAEASQIFGASHLESFVEDGVPPVTARQPVPGPALIGRSDFAPAGVAPDLGNRALRLVNQDNTVGWWVPEGSVWEGATDDGDETEIDGLSMAGSYDLLTALDHLLPPDTADFTNESSDPLPQGCVVIGDPADVVILGAAVEPGTVFDVRSGVVVIEQHTHVKSGSRLEGPVYVGPGCVILGGPVHACSIGPRCKVRGEISDSVLLGYANKSHDGFVGHSVLGRWVNLGAGTTTSNLKNTYGNVKLKLAGGPLETGRQFLGTLFGDHCKTAIGTMFNTGGAIGVGANVFGAESAVKFLPPFSWGTTGDRMKLDGFLKVAERVMPRRKVDFTDEVRRMLTAVYDHAVSK
jgi:UDP-N-acetylglucosamine diphosphorylase/glucosamine-1-phosphate N-acetyltransferase